MYYTDGFLAFVALIFAIWTTNYSNIIIITATGLILLNAFSNISGKCNWGGGIEKKPAKKSKK